MFRDVQIVENDKGWTWVEYDRTYKTAVGAQRAVLRDSAKLLVDNGGTQHSVVSRITWLPNTAVGLAVVMAISEVI